jgi:hypothetical protein
MHANNRIFNVNGQGDDMLLKTLELAFMNAGGKVAKAWKHDPKYGIILCWYYDKNDIGTNPLPAPMTPEQCLPFVLAYLKSDDAKTVECTGWDGVCDHDGSDSSGWRVYCGDWGHIGNVSSTIVAIKPVVLWHGK